MLSFKYVLQRFIFLNSNWSLFFFVITEILKNSFEGTT